MKELQVSLNSYGKTLRGMLHVPGGAGKYPCVIYFHGSTTSKHDGNFLFRDIARELLKANIASLRMDYSGSGDSDGEFSNVTLWSQINDAVSAVNYVLNRKEIDAEKIGVFGMGSGGFISTAISGKFPIKSIVLLNAVAKYKDYWKKNILPQSFGLRNRNGKKLDLKGLGVGKEYLKSVNDTEGKNLESLRNFNGAMLIVHEDKDNVSVPISEAYLHAKTAGSKIKTIIKLKSCDDLQRKNNNRGKIIKLSYKWFKMYLK